MFNINKILYTLNQVSRIEITGIRELYNNKYIGVSSVIRADSPYYFGILKMSSIEYTFIRIRNYLFHESK